MLNYQRVFQLLGILLLWMGQRNPDHQLIDGLSVYPMIYRVSAILLVVQDFAAIHSIMMFFANLLGSLNYHTAKKPTGKNGCHCEARPQKCQSCAREGGLACSPPRPVRWPDVVCLKQSLKNIAMIFP